jgi:hypothetical protein
MIFSGTVEMLIPLASLCLKSLYKSQDLGKPVTPEEDAQSLQVIARHTGNTSDHFCPKLFG